MSATVIAPVDIRQPWTRGLRLAVAVLVLVAVLAASFVMGRASEESGTKAPSSPTVSHEVHRMGQAF
jgi:hypothetical protein